MEACVFSSVSREAIDFEYIYSLSWILIFSQLAWLPSSSTRNFSSCFQLCFDFAMHHGSLYCPFKYIKLRFIFLWKHHNCSSFYMFPLFPGVPLVLHWCFVGIPGSTMDSSLFRGVLLFRQRLHIAMDIAHEKQEQHFHEYSVRNMRVWL